MQTENDTPKPKTEPEPTYIADARIQRLVRLWREREKCFVQAAMLSPGAGIERTLRDFALAYGQCAEELENPPEKLFRALGYCDLSAASVRGGWLPDENIK